MNNNKHKATIILVIFTFGFLISYPFKQNFWIGLISNMCVASMIGGLADWFAVTAIFRKPLGIYWPKAIFRTEIIPGKREQIVDGIVDIIENQLLSKENISNKVMDIDINKMLLAYAQDETIKSNIRNIFIPIIKDFLDTLEEDKVGELLDIVLKRGLEELELSTFLAQFLMFLRNNGYDDQLIDFSLEMFVGFVKNNRSHVFFTNFVENVITEYENGISSRALTIKMLLNFVLKKSPSDLARMLENGIVDSIYELNDRENSSRLKLKHEIDKLIYSLNNNEKFKVNIENWKDSKLQEIPSFKDMLTGIYRSFITENSAIDDSKIEGVLDKCIENARENFLHSNLNQEKFDAYMKKLIIKFVDKKHNAIGVIVKDKINKFSTIELVDLIEGIAGNDLQMIRINGSVVGGMVGVITYLLTYYIR